jgi:hypothetical protein
MMASILGAIFLFALVLNMRLYFLCRNPEGASDRVYCVLAKFDVLLAEGPFLRTILFFGFLHRQIILTQHVY